jgi:hypothetical protein
LFKLAKIFGVKVKELLEQGGNIWMENSMKKQ